MVRGRDACWEHCVLVDATRQKVRCNFCHREFSGGVYRMKFHLAQIKNKDIIPCTEVPDNVRDSIHSMLNTSKKQKGPKRPKMDWAMNGPQNSSSDSGGFPANNDNAGSSGQHESTCPSSLLPHPSSSVQPALVDDAQKQKHDDADKKIALFFFHNSIHFSASQSIYYQAMVDAIAARGTGYKAPSYDGLRSTLLNKAKDEIRENFDKMSKEHWKETGCSILADSWSDGRSKSILIFSVASPRGTQFLKSMDVSSRVDDAYYLFEVLDSVISKQEWVNMVLEEARTIAQYIYSESWIRNLMKKFTGGRELIRPKFTRFVAHFLCLRAIVFHEDNLKHMFSNSDFMSSVHSRTSDAQVIKSLLYGERFWKSAQEAVALLEPLVKLLRAVDGDMPAMGYIYEGIERAKLAIKNLYRGCEGKCMPILEVIERWNMQLHSHLHEAAAFLNPALFYSQNFKFDANVRNGFHAAMWKMFPEENDRVALTKEQPVYLNAQGALGSQFAVMGRTLNNPGDWWATYGYEVPVLQKAAMRILSQPCSSYRCKWNWNLFESLHSKKRSKMELEKLGDLVFVHCNLRLQAIGRSRATFKPVTYDEVDVTSEWPTEAESSSLKLDDTWLDDFPFE